MNQSRSKDVKRNTPILIIAGLIVIAIGVFFVANSGSAVVSSQSINPSGYLNQFEDSQHVLLDVRTPEEFTSGHIAGAVNISVQTLPSRLSEVPKDQPIVVYCRLGNRSATASQILIDAGYTQVYDLGGILEWEAQGLLIQ